MILTTKSDEVWIVESEEVTDDLIGSNVTVEGVVAGMDGVDVMDARKKLKANNSKAHKGSKAWIVKKKEQMERKGKVVKATSKYTGRKRRPNF